MTLSEALHAPLVCFCLFAICCAIVALVYVEWTAWRMGVWPYKRRTTR